MINKENILYAFLSLFLLTFTLISIKMFNLSINIINFVDGYRFVFLFSWLFALALCVNYYFLLINKLKVNIIISIIIGFLIIFSSYFAANSFRNTVYFQSIISNILFYNISIIEKDYPNSSDVIDLKSYITIGDYEAANSMPRLKFSYIDDIFDLTLDIKKKNIPELSEMFENFKKDGYINRYENKMLYNYYETKMYVESKNIPELEYLFIQLNRIDYIDNNDIELIKYKYYEILKERLKKESDVI